MPQYMLLIYDEEAQRASASEADMAGVMQEYYRTPTASPSAGR